MLNVTFHGVTNYVIPENVNWDEISIFEMKMDGGRIKFALMNDMTDDYLEIVINANQVSTIRIESSNC